MTDLKPCPFCGDEAMIIHFTQDACYVKCKNHDCMGGQKVYDTKAEAIEAWNARVRQTCENANGKCNSCGAIMYDAPNFCPNCGAKVVGE